jgi:tRNA A22 N-methylase
MAKQEKELKVADFVNEHKEDEVMNDVAQQNEKKEIKVMAKFKGLKTWQKALIGVGVVAGVGLGGKVIYDLVSKNREAATQIADVVQEAADAGLEVTEF